MRAAILISSSPGKRTWRADAPRRSVRKAEGRSQPDAGPTRAEPGKNRTTRAGSEPASEGTAEAPEGKPSDDDVAPGKSRTHVLDDEVAESEDTAEEDDEDDGTAVVDVAPEAADPADDGDPLPAPAAVGELVTRIDDDTFWVVTGGGVGRASRIATGTSAATAAPNASA